ncbi:porin [Aliagarivorans marinus]|uniref:porin n=1 Tax=Aliagarivorans marinus TaxID=561965 RepID=UPI00041CA935|nr:porin [Aliagarivorans marinus]
MKKLSVIALAIAAATTGGVNAASVYDDGTTSLKIGGRVEPRMKFQDRNDEDKSNFSDESRFRVAFSGKTQITDSLTGIGHYQMEIKDGSDQTVKTKELYAGLGTAIGSFTYGQQDGAFTPIADISDIASYHSGNHIGIIDGNGDEIQNTLTYAGDFDALAVTAHYTMNSDKDTDGYGLSAVYGFDFGLDLGLGYMGNDLGRGAGSADAFTFGAGYSIENFYIGGVYVTGEGADGDKDTDFDAYEISAQYKFGKARVVGVYAYQQNDPTGAAKYDETDQFALELRYDFNKAFRVVGSYVFEQIDGGEDQLVLGARYNF